MKPQFETEAGNQNGTEEGAPKKLSLQAIVEQLNLDAAPQYHIATAAKAISW